MNDELHSRPVARPIACWEDWRDENGTGYSCLLASGHDGSHEFTPDNEIYVKFADTDRSVVGEET